MVGVTPDRTLPGQGAYIPQGVPAPEIEHTARAGPLQWPVRMRDLAIHRIRPCSSGAGGGGQPRRPTPVPPRGAGGIRHRTTEPNTSRVAPRHPAPISPRRKRQGPRPGSVCACTPSASPGEQTQPAWLIRVPLGSFPEYYRRGIAAGVGISRPNACLL